MKAGKISYCLFERQCFIKFMGKISYEISYSFDDFIKYIFREKLADTFLIDLRKTQYIDSTNLGLLAQLALKQQQNNREKPIILSNNPNINIIIENMALTDVFIMVEDASVDDSSCQDLPDHEYDNLQKAQIMLKAHETLMQMSQENHDQFQDVVSLLKKEIN